jgi:ATP-dependent helicase HrpB
VRYPADQVPGALPIDGWIPHVVRALRTSRAVVVVAAPGAGKTTRIPPALAADGPLIVLQPRRVAARAIARRIADEQGWTLGREVGWHVRFERRFGPDTRVLLATEGILTSRLQEDPLASAFATIVIDEFHERSIHADLGLALARQAWLARDDLRLVVMSATLEAEGVSRFLGGCPVIDVPGAPHPLAVDYAPGQPLAAAAAQLWTSSRGSVLCFLPGAPEIRRAGPEVARALPGVPVVPLHGGLTADEQDRAVSDGGRRIVLATNIAETSLTVPGVDAVVDTGLHKVARYDAARALDALELERIPQASADQRAGRAARQGPGRALRLWDARDRLRPHREPDVGRIDLAGVALDLLVWGAEPEAFDWFEAPPAGTLDAARRLLIRLGALDGRGGVTPLGRRLQRLPIPPRLARVLVEAGGSRDAARACAVLAERLVLPPRGASTSCDLLAALDDWDRQPPHVQQVARQLEALAGTAIRGAEAPRTTGAGDSREVGLRRALFAGYPDRLAQRRGRGDPRVRLASGTGAIVAPESGVRDGDLLVALDLVAASRPGETDARIRLASRVEFEWVTPTGEDTVCALDPESGRVVASVRVRYDALVLAERRRAPDPEQAAALLAEAWLARTPTAGDAQLLRRLAFARLEVDVPALVLEACRAARTLDDVDLAAQLPHAVARELDRRAPVRLALPSGRTARLDYREDGEVVAAVKLQELFGVGETPVVGPGRRPVLLSLLAPNGRPVQTTRDLRSFWTTTYAEVRRELRGRYPRHAWPEDPWTAPPRPR